MLKKSTHILMYLATCILLVHSMVPHSHHMDSASDIVVLEETANQQSSLSELLEDLLGLDLGDDHLENFDSNRSSGNALSLFFVTPEAGIFELPVPALLVDSKTDIPFCPALLSSLESSAFLLRAPPVQVS